MKRAEVSLGWNRRRRGDRWYWFRYAIGVAIGLELGWIEPSSLVRYDSWSAR